MDWGIRDSVVVITGAANGIGRATADVFAAEGAMVVLADVDAALAQKSAGEIESAGGKAWAVQCDVSRSASVTAMVDAVVRALRAHRCPARQRGHSD